MKQNNILSPTSTLVPSISTQQQKNGGLGYAQQ